MQRFMLIKMLHVLVGAGLRNGAFYVEPRPVFFAHMMGIRAALPNRAIVMKALGMWHWEVRKNPASIQSQ
jgi:hypothetical protein